MPTKILIQEWALPVKQSDSDSGRREKQMVIGSLDLGNSSETLLY